MVDRFHHVLLGAHAAAPTKGSPDIDRAIRVRTLHPSSTDLDSSSDSGPPLASGQGSNPVIDSLLVIEVTGLSLEMDIPVVVHGFGRLGVQRGPERGVGNACNGDPLVVICRVEQRIDCCQNLGITCLRSLCHEGVGVSSYELALLCCSESECYPRARDFITSSSRYREVLLVHTIESDVGDGSIEQAALLDRDDNLIVIPGTSGRSHSRLAGSGMGNLPDSALCRAFKSDGINCRARHGQSLDKDITQRSIDQLLLRVGGRGQRDDSPCRCGTDSDCSEDSSRRCR